MASAMSESRSAYAPRDVLNAPAISAGIGRRSRERNDPEAVAAWLANHFYRHVVGNLQAAEPALQAITSLAQAARWFSPAPVPGWVAQKLKNPSPAASLWWVDPAGAEVLALESRLVEFLGSRQGTALEGKLMRVNCPQALALSAAEHAAIESDLATGWREHQPTAVQQVGHPSAAQGSFVELLRDSPALRAEMAFESQSMRHCLGQFSDRRLLQGGYGGHYADACEAGKLRLFSYRTGSNQPHITISANVLDDGRLAIDQIKGKQNRPPIARYGAEVQAFLNFLPTDDHTSPDAAAMGLVRLAGGWRHVSQLDDPADQLQAAHWYPALVRDMPRPSVLVQWLVAARQPALLRGLALASHVAAALEPPQ
ncbi:MAG: hypothetical protein JWP29_1752 [Rhodoferax sp.]|nr:hypothetical protein [Rhodoferax sp.]